MQLRGTSELQDCNLKFLLHCKSKRHNNANRRKLVLAKVLHTKL